MDASAQYKQPTRRANKKRNKKNSNVAIRKNVCVRKLLNVFHFISVYLGKSNIHGVCYVAKGELIWFEKVLWLVLVICSVTACILLGLSSLDRFYHNSIVTGLETNYNYWNTTLPSLTICPVHRINETLFNEYCFQHNINDQRKSEFFDFIKRLANATYSNLDDIPDHPTVESTLSDLGIKPNGYIDLIYKFTDDSTKYPIDTERVQCSEGNSPVFVRQVLTEFGICYIVNTNLGLEYSAEYMIKGKLPQKLATKPHSTYKDVVKGNSLDNDINYAFKGFITDIVIYVHSAYETMRVDGYSYYTQNIIEYEAQVVEILTEDDLEKSATIAQRKCRFQHESNLTHFKIYTNNFCIQECRLNMAMRLCGCIPHFYPNRIPNPKLVCNYQTLRNCINNHHEYLLKLKNDTERTCNCLPNCRDAFVKIMQIKQPEGAGALIPTRSAVVNVVNWPRNRYKRQMIFSRTELLVSIGSTAGLFLGFSVLGLLEMAYYFTLRVWCHLCGYKSY